MKIRIIIASFLTVTILATSCRFQRPLTARVRDTNLTKKDPKNNDQIIITKTYHYLTFRKRGLIATYSKQLWVSNCQLLTQTIHTRKTKGYTIDCPYYTATKIITYDEMGLKQKISKLRYKEVTKCIMNKDIFFEKGKRKSSVNNLKKKDEDNGKL
jgi:hypothetical protein